jgi:hypothetical protein
MAPVPRPPHRLLGDVTTAERRSHVILGLGRSCTVSLRRRPTHHHLFADAVSDTCVPNAAPTRPPFTPTATLFGALRASLFEARMLPADFCN